MRHDARVSLGVLLALLGALVALAVLTSVVVLLVWLRRSSRAVAEEVRSSYRDAIVGPERGQYRGGTGTYSRVRNTSWMVLTRDALVVRPLVGSGFTVPVVQIVGTRVEKSFGTHRNGQPVLVVETTSGEVGLTVADLASWQAALAALGP